MESSEKSEMTEQKEAGEAVTEGTDLGGLGVDVRKGVF